MIVMQLVTDKESHSKDSLVRIFSLEINLNISTKAKTKELDKKIILMVIKLDLVYIF